MLVALAGAGPATAPSTLPSASARTASYSERYGVLSEQNIFLKDRSVRTERRTTSSSQPSARPPEEAFVLRGVVVEDDGWRAYVEDTRAERMIRLAPGDKIARGQVTHIQIDAIAYDLNGQPQIVEIGQDLTGRTVAAMYSSDTPPSSGTTQASTSPSAASQPSNGINANDPNLSIEAQMRLRRQQGR
jgi:hypothetical protein